MEQIKHNQATSWHLTGKYYQWMYRILYLDRRDGYGRRLLRKLLYYYELIVLRNRNYAINHIISGKSIWLSWSHKLPVILQSCPYYAHNVARIGLFVQKKYPRMHFIDVGANVGDTVLLQRSEAKYPILCIEGDNLFYELLQINTYQQEDVTLAAAFVGEYKMPLSGSFRRSQGSCVFALDSTGGKIKSVPLDDLLKSYPAFQKSKMLKIDTDGFDLKVIRGAKRLLKTQRPVIFFEYDPYLLEQQQETGLSIFSFLKPFGYKYVLVYDNFGKLLITANVCDLKTWEELHQYFTGHQGARYCDLCVFHTTDKDLFREIRSTELDYFRKQPARICV